MTLCPTYTFIDRSNGKFNENMTFKKDYAALISAAWEIDKAYDQWLNSVDGNAEELNPSVKLGLAYDTDTDGIHDSIEERKKLLKKIIKLDSDNEFRKRMIGNAPQEIEDDDLEAMALQI